MARSWTIEAAREESILAAGAGFPFLVSFGTTWLLAAAVSFLVAPATAAWIYLLQGVLAVPAAFGLQVLLRYPRASPDHPLNPLALQLFFIQPVAFPVFILVLDLAPHYVPAAFAVVVGAHFLPFSWLFRTPIYTVLGVAVSAGTYALVAVTGEASLHYTGFFVGGSLVVAALLLRRHAREVARAREIVPAAPEEQTGPALQQVPAG